MRKTKTLLTAAALFCGIMLSFLPLKQAKAQPGSLDLTFDPGTGANSTVHAIALQPDGKIIIGGGFTSYNGIGRNYIARLNADGSLDTSFNPGTGANTTVYTITLQPDGKIIIGGWFTEYNGTAINHIARLNADGSLDTSFNSGTGANSGVLASAIQPDGKIIIGGWFADYNGTVRNRIARLNADGSLDMSFNPGTGANDRVNSIALQPDGKIIIGGAFIFFNATGRNRIARLNANGSLDTGFNPGSGANGLINTVSLQADGKIIIGGEFTSYNGTGRNYIARLNSNGSLDTSFNPGSGADWDVVTSSLQPDGKIIIGGLFTNYNNTVINKLARLNANGSLDTSFNTGSGPISSVFSSAIQPDGKIIIGGNFSFYNGTERNKIARIRVCLASTGTDVQTACNSYTWPTNGNTYTSSGSYTHTLTNAAGCDSIVTLNLTINYNNTGIDVQSACNAFTWIDGNTYTSSNNTATYTIVGGAANGCDSIVALNFTYNPATGTDVQSACNAYTWIDGNTYTSSNNTATYTIVGGATNGCDSLVTLNLTINSNTGTDVITACDSYIWIDGNTYTSSNNTATYTLTNAAGCDSVITLNLTINYSNTGTDVITACNSYTWINGITYTSSNNTATHTFTNAAGCDSVVTLNLTISGNIGNLDLSFNPGTGANGGVGSIALQPDGKIIIGGNFSSYNGTGVNRIARLNADGSLDTSFDPGTGANSWVQTSAIQPDGKILIGGWFTEYNGTGRNYIARLNSDGSLDTSFNPGTGASGRVWSIVLQPDGKIIIGGEFTTYNGTGRFRIARLNSDGSLDMSFDPGTGANSYGIRSVALQPDGKIIIGGDFFSYNGTSRNRIARLNSDGSLDMSFNPGAGANATVWRITLQPDGKIIIGGDFTNYNGRYYIARLNSNGSLDTSFNPGGANYYVKNIALQPDGKIIIGGLFTNYNDTLTGRIARLNSNGSLDMSFNPCTGANDFVRISALQPDGKIIIGGDFSSYNSTGRNRIARINGNCIPSTGIHTVSTCNAFTWIDGNTYTSSNNTATYNIVGGAANGCDSIVTLNLTFNSATGTDVQTACNAFTWIDGNTYTSSNNTATYNIVGGAANGCDSIVTLNLTFNTASGTDVQTACNAFTWIDGNTYTSSNNTATYNIVGGAANGCDSIVTLNLTFNTATGTDVHIACNAFTWIDGNTYTSSNNTATYNIVGGAVNGCDSLVTLNLTINIYGSLDLTFNPGTGANGTVNTIVLQPDGKIIIGGLFSEYNGTGRNCIARLNANGSLDTNFNPGTGANTIVYTTTIQPDGKILIGGNFTSYNGTGRNYIARLNADGSLDTSFNPGTGANNSVWTSAIQPDGKILIGGNFTSYNGTGRNYIARLNSDGSLDTSFNPGTGANAAVWRITLQSDGKILIGGAFTSYNGTGRNRIARLNADGSLDTSFNIGIGANNIVYTITLQPDGKIIIGGEFTSYNGTGRNRIARLNSDGSLDTNFNPATGANDRVYNITQQSDGKILIGGWFTSYNGTGRNRIARLNSDGSLDTNFNPGTGANDRVSTIILQSDGQILIGGWFTSYNGSGRNRIARILGMGLVSLGTHTISACNAFTWIDGNTYTSSNNTATYTIIGGAANGCDSLVTLNLTFNPATGTDTVTTCDSYTWIDGITYTSSNNTATYNIVGGAANGCDSIVSLNLTINYINTGTDVITACDSYTWIDGITYTSSNNTATHTLSNTAGCDSVVTLNLTINYSNTGTDVITACNSYTWIDGNTYTSSNNTATHTLTNAAGCDSVVTLNLTINYSNTDTDVITACDSYTWIDGIIYTSSNNTATHTLTNASGCDSVVTLNLIINYSNIGTDVITACDSFTWIDGNTYTSSNNTATHTLTNVAGCDSVVTLNLTINYSNTGTEVITACDSYTWIDGITYTSSNNTATYTLINAAGCDSVVTLNLTINYSNTGTDVITACNSYTWIDGNTYTSSNNTATYNIVGGAANGCDSIITLNLIIDTSLVASYYSYLDPNNSQNLFIVNTSSGNIISYLWDFGDGNTSTNPYPSHTYATAGNYYVCLTVFDSLCSNTFCDSLLYRSSGIKTIYVISPSQVSIKETNITDITIKIYPNPTSGIFFLESNLMGKVYTISDMHGRVITQNTIDNTLMPINLEMQANGVYFIKIDTQVLKLVKQ
jgi:uncharacterized delta-60 repeat protein